MNRCFLPHDRHRLRQSRPHLGTAYEKIAADVDRALPAPRRRRRPVPHGQRRALAERLPQGAGSSARIRSRTATAWQREFLDVWSRLDISFDDFIRTTEAAAPRRRAGVDSRGSPTPATSTKATTKAGTASRARRSSRRRISSTGSARSTGPKPEWIREKNYFFRLSKYQQPLLEHFAAHPDFSCPKSAATKSCVCSRAGSTTSRSAARASPGAFRCRSDPSSVVYVWFDALINYIDGRRVRHRLRRCSSGGGRPICT